MKRTKLFLTLVALLGYGSNAMLHAQTELDASFPSSRPNDATWSASSNGYRLAWSNLGKQLALTSTNNTLTLIDNCDFSGADELTMHMVYDIDSELPDGYGLFQPRATLKSAVNGETNVELRQTRDKSHERTMDFTIDPSVVGGLNNIQSIYIQCRHTGDNGGALYVTDVYFDAPIVIASESTTQDFSSRTTNGNVYLFQNLEVGTFADATRITFDISNVFNNGGSSRSLCEVYATLSEGDDVNITPTSGTTKWSAYNGSQDCYLNNISDKSKITGIYIKPLCESGFCTFDATSNVYNGSTLIRTSDTKTFNARTSNTSVNLFTSDKPVGTFTNAQRLRLNYSNLNERNISGGRYELLAVLDGGSTTRITIPYSTGTDNKTVDIPSNIDKANIVNFRISQVQPEGELNFSFTTDVIANSTIQGDGFGPDGVSSDKSTYLTLYKDFGNNIDTESPAFVNGNASLSGKTFTWTLNSYNAAQYNLSSDWQNLNGAKVFIKTSEASSNPSNNIRVRIGWADSDASRSNWVVFDSYGDHIIDIDDLTLNGSSTPLTAEQKEGIRYIQIAGSGSVSSGSIILDNLTIVRDNAILGEVDTRFPASSKNNPGFANNVVASDWTTNNTLTWNEDYGNQVYLAWPTTTNISDLTKFESITLHANSSNFSSYRLFIYYGDEKDNDNNYANKIIENITTSDVTLNIADLFENNTDNMQNVKCIALAGSGSSGSCKFEYINLNRKSDSYTAFPINGGDLAKFRQITTNISQTSANKVSYTIEYLMNDNSVITTSEIYTPAQNATSLVKHFSIQEALTKEQIELVKNVRIKITSYEDASIDFSRIYLSDKIALEWDQYQKSVLNNKELRFEPSIINSFNVDWDTYTIPIYTEDLRDLKRITVEASSDETTSYDFVIELFNEAGESLGFHNVSNATSPINFYDFTASNYGSVARFDIKFKTADSVSFDKLILYKSLPIYAEPREDLAVTDMTYYRADDNTYYNDTYHTQIADVVMGTSTPVVFGEVGATYVGRDGDIQSYYIMDSNDNFLTVDRPNESKVNDLINIYGTKSYTFGDGSYILETNTRPSGYADLSDYSELRIWKNYTSTASTKNNDAPVRVFFVANTRDLTGYLTVDSVGTNFPLLVTERYCSVDLDEIKKLCNGKAYLIGIKGMNASAAPTVTNVSVYKTKANYVLGGDMVEGSNAENCITNALADVNATYIDATDVATTNNYTLPRDPANPNCLIYTNNEHLIGQNVICNGKATGDITLSYGTDFYAPYDVDMNGNTVSYTANISDNLSTLVLPFSTTIPEATDLRVYTVYASIDEGTPYVEAHQLTPGDILPANTPVLIRVPEGGSASTSWRFEGTSIEATPFVMKNEGFVGTYTAQRAPGSGSGYRTYNPYVKSDYDSYEWGTPELIPNRYVLQKVDGKFIFNSVNRDEAGNMYKPKMKGFRCWLVSDNDLVNAAQHSTEQSNAKAFIKFVDFNATNIKCVTETSEDKTIAKGIFNLQGQRLEAPQKGFNIINGKVIYNK